MKSMEKAIEIAAAPEKVFDFLIDANNSPRWIPSMRDPRKIQGKGEGRSYEWTYRMMGFDFSGKTTTVVANRPSKIVDKSGGEIQSEWTYTLEPTKAGTKVALKISYTVPTPLLGRVAEALIVRRNEREFDLALENLKDIVEHTPAATA